MNGHYPSRISLIVTQVDSSLYRCGYTQVKKPFYLLRLVSYILLFTVFTQSCVVYHDASVPISEAVDKGGVLLITNDGYRYEYKIIVKKDSIYYGYDSHPSAIIDALPLRTQIDTTEIYSIQLKDKKKSNKNQFLGAAVTLLILGICFLIIANSEFFNY